MHPRFLNPQYPYGDLNSYYIELLYLYEEEVDTWCGILAINGISPFCIKVCKFYGEFRHN